MKFEELKPLSSMVLVQFVLAAVNIFYKLAINDGMDLMVLVAYRFIFAIALLAPQAFFMERNKRPKMTFKVLMLAFFCGLFGCSMFQIFYLTSIKLTSATFTTAMSNLIPAFTFILALICRYENLAIKSLSGQAKILGTLVGIGGAMLLTFYKGIVIDIWRTHINLLRTHNVQEDTTQLDSGNHIKGSMFAVASCVSYAIWLMIQAKMSKEYPCHYSSTALMCVMGAIQTVIFTLCVNRHWAMWKLGFNIRLLSAAFSGIVGSGLILIVLNWCIKKKGPLYASIFSPLMLVIVAVFSSLMLDEKLHLGSILGTVLIVIGLYLVLWGKGREAAKVTESPPLDEFVEIVIEPRFPSSQVQINQCIMY